MKKFNYQNKILTLKIIGDIDHHSAKSVREYADALIFDKKPRLILFDLSAVEFMDSSGLGLILGRYNEIRRLGGACGIMGLTGATRKIIQMTGLFGIIEEYRSLAAFKKKVRINI
jgi:stage II sporulation protein AA (anti-sigma F factor antagonist)